MILQPTNNINKLQIETILVNYFTKRRRCCYCSIYSKFIWVEKTNNCTSLDVTVNFPYTFYFSSEKSNGFALLQGEVNKLPLD